MLRDARQPWLAWLSLRSILRPARSSVNLTMHSRTARDFPPRSAQRRAILADFPFIILTLHHCWPPPRKDPMPIYIVAIAWMFVVVLMAAAEAMAGSVVGALLTLLFYGILPLTIVLYLISTPARRKSRARREAAARDAARAAPAAAAATVPPMAQAAGDATTTLQAQGETRQTDT